MRRLGLVLLTALAVLAAAGVAAYLLVARYDFGPLAANRASAALGRPVSIGSLRVSPGWWITVDLAGARLDNVAGGSRPAMVEVGRLTAEVEAASLLRGPIVVRRLAISGLSVLLERTADGTRNWRFGVERQSEAGSLPDRSWFPTLLEARLSGGEIVFRTSRGAELRTRLDEAAVLTKGADQPVRMAAEGAYNETPVRLEGDLQPIAILRDAATPYGADLRFASGEMTLRFDGTMTEPFDVDGARGTLALVAPTLRPLLAIAGEPGDSDVSLTLDGSLERSGDVWRLANLAGALDSSGVRSGSLRLVEGARGRPDELAVELAFDRLDLNELLGSGRRGRRSDADIPLRVDRAPDTLLRAHLSAREVAYGRVEATDAVLAGGLTPGRVAADELSLTYLGARIRADGRVEAAERGARLSVDVSASHLDVQRLRRELEFGPVPLHGQLEARVAMVAGGDSLNAAARTARISAAVSMAGGAIEREVIETASIDMRRLFRKAEGMSSVSCLLGVLDMEAGLGTVAPLRVRSALGTIVGHARFDLNRRQLDLTVGSESATTSAYALDIPVRISGPFSGPSVRPARWSAAGRALLAAREDISRLPHSMQRLARSSGCLADNR
jgi:AsmA family protein